MMSKCRFDGAEGTEKCVFVSIVWPSRRLVTCREYFPVQGGAEGTDERVLVLHAVVAECEMRQVTSVEDGHDVERVTEVTRAIRRELP